MAALTLIGLVLALAVVTVPLAGLTHQSLNASNGTAWVALYRELAGARHQRGDKLAVILAGHMTRSASCLTPVRRWPRFPAIIEFPGYTPSQLAAVFATLAREAGFTLTLDAARKAAAALALADGGGSGNAWAAVHLLDQARHAPARRIAHIPGGPSHAALGMITADDIPGHLQFRDPDSDQQPGHYL